MYVSIAVVWLIFMVTVQFRKMTLASILIGLLSIGYSIAFDVSFGDHLHLFYYISPEKSTLYIILAAATVYAPLNIIYTMFLPKESRSVLIYTACWIAGMSIFEFASVASRTIVFTGWQPIPWSGVVYIAAYTWIYVFYRYLSAKIPSSG